MKKVIVFGAGMAGLAAAKHLADSGFRVLVLEKESLPGGLACTFEDDDGYVYDRGPHYFFSTLSDKLGLTDACYRVPYYESICYRGKYCFFPFGLLKRADFFLSVSFAYAKTLLKGKRKYGDLKNLLLSSYGRSFTEKILSPLIEKWSGVRAEDISEKFGKRLLPGSIDYVIYSVIKRLRGYTEDYYRKGRYIVYPLGGMRSVFNKMIENSKFEISFNSEITSLKISSGSAVEIEVNGKNYDADYFVSSIPVDDLARISASDVAINDRLKSFKYRGVVFLYLKIDKPNVLEKLWYWYPERRYPFYRISEQISLDGKPKDRSVVVFEFGSFPGDAIWKKQDREIVALGTEQLEKEFGVNPGSVAGCRVERVRTAYPILLKEYEEKQGELGFDFGLRNLFLVGRTGLFKYHMLEEAYDSGIEVAEHIKSLGLTGESNR